MERLGSADLHMLLDGVQHLYGAGSLDVFPRCILHTVGALIPGVRYGYTAIDLPRQRVVIVADPPGSLDRAMDAIAVRHVHHHPLIVRYEQTGDGRAYTISDIVTRQQFHRSPLYEGVYRPIGAEDQLGIAISISRNVTIGVGVNRDRVGFTERDRLLFNLLRIHLTQAYRNAEALTWMRDVMAESERAVIVLDREGHVRFSTDPAWRILARDFAYTSRSGAALPDRLHAWVQQQQTTLVARDDAPPPLVPFTYQRAGRQVTVRFVPGEGVGKPDQLVFREQPEGAEALLAPLGLSRRETEVLVWITRGKTDREIAATLSVSVGTVHKHVEHVLRKLQVSTRTAAAAHAVRLLGATP
ncbi:MAG: helix-turn-helix transcriptional regulator [Thermomicrobiales bacterium]